MHVSLNIAPLKYLSGARRRPSEQRRGAGRRLIIGVRSGPHQDPRSDRHTLSPTVAIVRRSTLQLVGKHCGIFPKTISHEQLFTRIQTIVVETPTANIDW